MRLPRSARITLAGLAAPKSVTEVNDLGYIWPLIFFAWSSIR